MAGVLATDVLNVVEWLAASVSAMGKPLGMYASTSM